MELFEINNIEVTDFNIEVTFWNLDNNECQSIMFKTGDFEDWLLDQRNISISSYWDQWDPKALNGLNDQIVLDDVKRYLSFKYGVFKSTHEKVAPSYSDKKPMKRVSESKIAKLRSQI